MPISFQCTNCQSIYTVQDELAGRRVRCKCGAELIIPAPVARVVSNTTPSVRADDLTPPSMSGSMDDLLSEEYPVRSEMPTEEGNPFAAQLVLKKARLPLLGRYGKEIGRISSHSLPVFEEPV